MKKRVGAAILAPSIVGLALAAVAQAHQPSTNRPADIRKLQGAEPIWDQSDRKRGRDAKQEEPDDDWRKKLWEDQERNGG